MILMMQVLVNNNTNLFNDFYSDFTSEETHSVMLCPFVILNAITPIVPIDITLDMLFNKLIIP